jgi:hypothetical protein
VKLDESDKAEHEDNLHDAVRKYIRERVGEREVEKQGDRWTTGGGEVRGYSYVCCH